jgi:hypothetical protein
VYPNNVNSEPFAVVDDGGCANEAQLVPLAKNAAASEGLNIPGYE